MLYFDFYFEGNREARFCGRSYQEALERFYAHFHCEPERVEQVDP
jgi:hypothetical protein